MLKVAQSIFNRRLARSSRLIARSSGLKSSAYMPEIFKFRFQFQLLSVLLTLLFIQRTGFCQITSTHLQEIQQFTANPHITNLDLSFLYKFPHDLPLNNKDIHEIFTALLPEDALDRIVTLNISGNSFTEFPEEITSLKNVRVVRAEQANISKLPSTFPAWNQLQILDLSKNRIAEFPQELWKLPKLQHVIFKNNQKRIDLLGIEQIYKRMPIYSDYLDGSLRFSPKHCTKNRLIRQYGWIGVEKILNSWKKMIHQKGFEQALSPNKSSVDDFESLIKYLKHDITYVGNLDNVILVCDRYGTLRSIAYLEIDEIESEMHVLHLMSSPSNYFRPYGKPIQGAGQAAVKEAIFLSFLHGFKGELYLYSKKGAETFYTKQGFQQKRSFSNDYVLLTERMNTFHSDVVQRFKKYSEFISIQ